MYKNWQAICGEKNNLLRLLLSSADEKHVMEGLEKGFPEYFSEKEQKLFVPLSAIQAWQKEGAVAKLAEEACEHFGVPYFEFSETTTPPTVAEKLKELLGEKYVDITEPEHFQEYVFVTWNDVRCLVITYDDVNDLLILVPEGVIDLNS